MKSTNSLFYERLEMTSYNRTAVGDLSVAVVGCGALGSEVSRLLGLLGIGSVLLIDPDKIEVVNLSFSPYLHSKNVLGRAKADVLAENLAEYFPNTNWQALPCEIADTGFLRLQSCALLFSCTDNMLARVETSYAAYRLRLPVMDAGLKGHAFWAGRVAWLPGGSAACYLCQLSESRRADLLSFSLAASQSCSTNLNDNQILSSTPTMAAIVAGLQVDLGLRLAISMAEKPVQACAWDMSLPLPETNWRSFTIPRSADCPWHASDVSLYLIELPIDVTLNESLLQLCHDSKKSYLSLELDWPLCVKARCSTCRHIWSPMVRLAALRRRTACPICGQSRLHSVEILSRIAHGDPFAMLTPRQLGLPADHLFTISDTGPS